MEQTLRSVLRQEAEELGYKNKYVAEYVKQQKALDREERAARSEAEMKNRVDEIHVAEIQAEKKREDEIQIKIKIHMAKVEADKELTLKGMELKAQAQASTSAAVDPPPRNRDAKSPKLPAFIDEKDELESYLLRLNATPRMLYGRKHVGYSTECITCRKSHGSIYQHPYQDV